MKDIQPIYLPKPSALFVFLRPVHSKVSEAVSARQDERTALHATQNALARPWTDHGAKDNAGPMAKPLFELSLQLGKQWSRYRKLCNT